MLDPSGANNDGGDYLFNKKIEPEQPKGASPGAFEAKQKIWHDYYYDPKTGYVSAPRLWKKLPASAREGVSFFNTFLPWYEAQKTVQLTHIPTRVKGQKFNAFTASYPMQKIQMDYIIYDRYMPLTGPAYKYILVVIDVYSRYAAVRPCLRRTSQETIKAFANIMKEMGKGDPKVVNCDQEFGKGQIAKWFQRHKVMVNLSYTAEKNKNPIVERFNRTLASKLQRWRVATNRSDWPSVLQDIVFNYNNTYHSTIKAIPQKVWSGEERNNQIATILPSPFKEGDQVRVQLNRRTFAKGDENYYSSNLYQIDGKQGQRYLLKNAETGKPYVRKQGPLKSYEIRKISQIEQYRPPNEPLFQSLEPSFTAKESKSKLAIIQKVTKATVPLGNTVTINKQGNPEVAPTNKKLLPLNPEGRKRKAPAWLQDFETTTTKKKRGKPNKKS